MQELVYTVNKLKIKENIDFYHQFGRVFYPIKTNDSYEIIKIIDSYLDYEDCYLISSISHYSILKFCGISPDRMIFINVLTSNEIRSQIYDLGVRQFIFGDYKSLVRFCFLYKDIRVGLRLSLSEFNSDANVIGVQRYEIGKILEFSKSHSLDLGLQLYFDRNVIDSHYSLLRECSTYINDLDTDFKFVNIGGLERDLYKEAKNFFGNFNLEVGEGLLNNAVDCRTKVSLKTDKAVFLEIGIYGGMLDSILYNKKFVLRVESSQLTLQETYENTKKVLICGGSCDTKDILGYYYMSEDTFNSLHTGTEVIVENTGAYFDVFQMRYASDINRRMEVI